MVEENNSIKSLGVRIKKRVRKSIGYFVKIGNETIRTYVKKGKISLDLRNRKISDMDEIKGLENLTELQRLILHNNDIEEIKGLENMIKLEELTLGNNPVFEQAKIDFGGADDSPYGFMNYPQRLVEYSREKKGIKALPVLPGEDDLTHKQRIEKLSALFKISDRVRLEIVAKLMDMEQEELLNYFIENSDQLGGIKIDGDFIRVISEEDVGGFMDLLDKQFESWERKEKGKIGKL